MWIVKSLKLGALRALLPLEAVNLKSFISRRILRSDDKSRISRPIVRIATTGIAVGMAMMLVSVAIVNGFQKEIRNKVIGFGSHFQVTRVESNFSKDSQRMMFNQEVYEEIKNTAGVKHVQVFATKPGIIETSEALQGVVIKGVSKDFDWSFLSSALKSGTTLHPDSSESLDILISEYLSRRLKVSTGDKLSIYVFNDDSDPRQRNFRVRGIYNTGLEDFDQQFVFVDLGHLQRMSGWGLRLEAQADSICLNGIIAVGAQAFGGSGEYTYEWSDPEWSGEGPHLLFAHNDTTIRVIARDDIGTLPDTSWIKIDFLNDSGQETCGAFSSRIESTDSDRQYIGGYEVLIDDYDLLLETDDRIFSFLTTHFLQTQKITDRYPEIFSWLSMLDVNVLIIIVLMVVISVVNMTSALLIIILERQNMIGTLKALGMPDTPVIEIFIRNAASIIGRGMLWGNLVGLGFILIQHQFGIIALDPVNYYVDKVPVEFNLFMILALNIGTIVVCTLFMILPALYVVKISPIKAIRFS